MAGDEPNIMRIPKTYTIKEAMQEVKRQQSLPTQKQSKWYNVRTGSRVYFINVR